MIAKLFVTVKEGQVADIVHVDWDGYLGNIQGSVADFKVFLDGLEVDIRGHPDGNVEGRDALVFTQIGQVEELPLLKDAPGLTHKVADERGKLLSEVLSIFDLKVGARGECSLAQIMQKGAREVWLQIDTVVTLGIGNAELIDYIAILDNNREIVEADSVDKFNEILFTQGADCVVVGGMDKLVSVLNCSCHVFSVGWVWTIVVTSYFFLPLETFLISNVQVHHAKDYISEMAYLHEKHTVFEILGLRAFFSENRVKLFDLGGLEGEELAEVVSVGGEVVVL